MTSLPVNKIIFFPKLEAAVISVRGEIGYATVKDIVDKCVRGKVKQTVVSKYFK